jgi:CheY-like chemotaxis protein/CRP-like cAMP-binding protein
MKTIAIIEDNKEVRENLAEILELSGYKCITAENGKIGVKSVRDYKPDLILCDVMMPELDGFGVLKILNQDPELMHIPFMFLTAKAEKSDFRKGMGLGADDYITKPYDDVELLEALEIRLNKASKLKTIDNSDKGIRQFFNQAKGEKELSKLSEDREVRTYQKKDTVYQEGQYPKWLYFVVEGQVKIIQTNEFDKDLITHVYGAGDFFGFMPLLNGGVYSDQAVTFEKTVLRLIPVEDFKLLLFNNRDFAAKFINMLAKHADHNEKQLIDLAYSSVRKKVANALLLLEHKATDGKIRVMREDVAAMAGTAKETTIRTLSDFKNEGLIEIASTYISIIDEESLIEMPQ